MSDRTNGNDNPDEIETRIRATQDDLRSDLDALEDKVSPENLKRQAQERVEDTTDAVRDKAVEATREAGEAVRERIDDYSERFRNDDRMSAMSLLGLAAVIGIGLLLTRGSDRGRRDGGHYTRHPDSDYRHPDAMGPRPTPGAYRTPRT